MKTKTLKLAFLLAVCLFSLTVGAQQTLSLQNCRDMALDNNNNIKIHEEKVKMAEYDKKIAFSNYLPKFTAEGTYMYNEKAIQLLSDDKINAINTVGSSIQGNINGHIDPIIQSLMENPYMAYIINHSETLQNLINNMHHIGVLEALDAIGQEITKEFYLDTHNVYAGMITVQEPVYAGGKIRAYNKMVPSLMSIGAIPETHASSIRQPPPTG